MKMIEKITRDGDTVIFEVLTSRKELAGFLKELLAKEWHPENKFSQADISIYYYDKTKKFFSITEGDTMFSPNISKIDRLVCATCSTTVIYGPVDIVYSERYGDWEAEL